MIDKRTSLEVIAPTVEEAVARGLNDLGLPEEAVDVEVLDAGSRGLFGIGARQARVRLTIKALPAEKLPARAVEEVQPQPRPEPQAAPAPVPAVITPPAPVDIIPPAQPAPAAAVASRDEVDEHALQVARETVSELLAKMRVRAQVSAKYGEPDDDRSSPYIQVDVRGSDLSILIGPHAETLNALQYISGLIVSGELGHSVSLVVDVEGYRARRAQQIRQLARRMADQAIKTGKRQVLEPMPASERRLIHIELRSNPAVTTESVGEEPRRKVTIIPKA